MPVETVPTGAHQQALWGGSGANDERAHRALARVQSLLGPGSVRTAVPQGGRTPAERTRLVPWGDDPVPRRPREQPWPGRLPPPAPTVLLDPPRPVQVVDDNGRPVQVTEAAVVPRPPARYVLPGQQPVPITNWAGPWPIDERWWDEQAAHRVALFLLVDVRGHAYLASCRLGETPRWTLDAIYD